MKVLLIATNQADKYMSRMSVRPVPIGLAYLAASIDEDRHEIPMYEHPFDGALHEIAVPLFATAQLRFCHLSLRYIDYCDLRCGLAVPSDYRECEV